MKKEFRLPDVGEGLTEADIVTWRVKLGDVVTINQVIVEIETAKSLVELPSPWAGTVTGLLVDEGTTVDVGTPIIALETGAVSPRGDDPAYPRGDDPPVDPPAKGGDPLSPPSRGNEHNPLAPGLPAYRAGDAAPVASAGLAAYRAGDAAPVASAGLAAYRAGDHPVASAGLTAYRAGDDTPVTVDPGLAAYRAGDGPASPAPGLPVVPTSSPGEDAGPARSAEPARQPVLVGYGVRPGATTRRPRRDPSTRPGSYPATPPMAAQPPAGQSATAVPASSVPAPPSPRALAKPPVRRLARDLGVDLGGARGDRPARLGHSR